MADVTSFFISSAGFVEASLESVGRELSEWRRELGHEPRAREVHGALAAQLKSLNPLLTTARPRELLVEAGKWVAYFDSFARETDASSTCAVLADRMGVRALKVFRAPSGMDHAGMSTGTGVQVHLWGPGGEDPLGYLRTLNAIVDGERWVFDQSGTPLDFEETENYTKRRIKDRFTADMLDRYCAALGIDLVDPAAYGPRGILVESNVVIPPGTQEVWI